MAYVVRAAHRVRGTVAAVGTREGGTGVDVLLDGVRRAPARAGAARRVQGTVAAGACRARAKVGRALETVAAVPPLVPSSVLGLPLFASCPLRGTPSHRPRRHVASDPTLSCLAGRSRCHPEHWAECSS